MPARSSTKLCDTLRMVRPRIVTSSALTVSASWAPPWATTRRRAGGWGAAVRTATTIATARLAIVSPGGKPVPGQQGSAQPGAETVRGGAGADRDQVTRHRGRERVHPEIDGLARV